MADFAWGIDNWAPGVVKGAETDRVVIVDAKNTQFWRTSQGEAVLGTRPRARVSTIFTVGGAAQLTDLRFLFPYSYANSGETAHTDYLAVIDAAGKLVYKEQDDTWDQAVLTPPAGYPYPSTCIPPQFTRSIDATVMNGRLFLVAGTVKRSLLGKEYQPFGMTAPQATANKVAANTTSIAENTMPADIYDLYVTTYNSDTGAESDWALAGTLDTNLAPNQRPQVIRVAVTSSTVQGDKWRVYLRRQSTQAQAYLVQEPLFSSGEEITTDGGIPLAVTTTAFINLTAAEMADLVIPLPLAGENAPLPAEISYITTHGQRMVAASKRSIYWSKLGQPDSFPPQNTEPFASQDGAEITGLMSLDDELLLVTTTTGTYGVFGFDPQYWTIKPIDRNVGCVGKRSMVKFDGGAAWWSAQFGPVIYQNGQIEKIGLELLGRLDVTLFNVATISAGWDPLHETIVWNYPNVGDVENTILLPFNYRVGRWCASAWDPFTVAAMATGWDSSRQQRLFLGDTQHTLHYFDTATKYDGFGPALGRVTGTFTGNGSAISSIVDTGFYATGSGIVGHRLTIVDSNEKVVATRKITALVATTEVVLDRTFDSIDGEVYTYYIGVPHMEITTGWIDGGAPFAQKRFDRLFADMQSTSTTPVLVEMKLDRNDQTTVLTQTITPGQGETGTTNATWDVPVVTTAPFVKKRFGIWKSGHVLQCVFSHARPETVVFSRVAITGRMLHDRYYI